MNIKKLCRISDSDYRSGDPFDNGEVTGTVKYTQVNSDGEREVVIESTDEDNNPVEITVAIEDSSMRDKFFMDLLLKNKAECPNTGKWEIREKKLYHNDEEISDLPDSVEEIIKKVDKEIEKVTDAADPDKEWDSLVSKLWNGERVSKPSHWTKDDWVEFKAAVEDFQLSDDNPEGTVMKEEGDTVWFETPALTMDEINDGYKFSQYANTDDTFIDDLFEKGEALIPLGNQDAETVFANADELVQGYAGPDGYIDLGYDVKDGNLHVWINETSNID